MKSIIPIFPLNLVVFPFSKYPLHIFEEKYKKLIIDSISANDGFGIVSMFDNRLSEIGCFVKIDEIIKTYDNGSMDIIIKGYDRFKILNTEIGFDNDYSKSTIIPFYDEETVLINSNNVSKLIDKFKNIVDYTELSLSESYWRNLNNTIFKSFKIAEKCGLTLNQQQDLLMLQNENSRIEYLLNHFRNIDNYIENTKEMKNLILNDGYIN